MSASFHNQGKENSNFVLINMVWYEQPNERGGLTIHTS